MYKYIIFDAQFILRRNSSVMKTTNAAALTKSFYGSISKLTKAIDSSAKPILLWDSAPYHRSKITSYKSDRTYYNEEEYSKMDPESKKAKLYKVQLDISNTLASSKRFIISDKKYKSLIFKGYEADDLSLIASSILSTSGTKAIICSSDSDWKWNTNPGVDYYKIVAKKLTKFDTLYNKYSKYLDGGRLYDYHAVKDSLGRGHNGIKSPLKKGTAVSPKMVADIIFRLHNQLPLTYTGLNTEAFNNNLRTFNIEEFPDYNEVYSKVMMELL